MKANHTYAFFDGGSYAYYLAVDNNDRTHVLSHNADGWTALSLRDFHEIAGHEAADALAAALTKMLANPPKTIDFLGEGAAAA